MKKLIPFLALLLSFSFACQKGAEVQVAEDQSKINQPNDVQPQADDRALCCCDLSVTSVAFGGLNICGIRPGILPPGVPCSITTTCGTTCGEQRAFPGPGKNLTFCYEDTCPICFTNPAGFAIQIRINCGGWSGPIDLAAGQTRCFMSDCNGNYIECF